MVEVKFNLVKRDFVWMGFIVVLLGVGFGYAYGGNDPAVMGHSDGEVESIDWSQITNRPAGLDNGDDVGGGWPSGNYCIVKGMGKSCPAGFTSTEVCSDGGAGQTLVANGWEVWNSASYPAAHCKYDSGVGNWYLAFCCK